MTSEDLDIEILNSSPQLQSYIKRGDARIRELDAENNTLKTELLERKENYARLIEKIRKLWHDFI